MMDRDPQDILRNAEQLLARAQRITTLAEILAILDDLRRDVFPGMRALRRNITTDQLLRLAAFLSAIIDALVLLENQHSRHATRETVLPPDASYRRPSLTSTIITFHTLPKRRQTETIVLVSDG